MFGTVEKERVFLNYINYTEKFMPRQEIFNLLDGFIMDIPIPKNIFVHNLNGIQKDYICERVPNGYISNRGIK